MARYTGPRAKMERKFGLPIFGNTKAFQKKSYPPGQHGRLRRKRSAYAYQNLEKQQVRSLYGLSEKQFRNLFRKAAKKKGATGTMLIQLLEARLDNVVYRLNLAPTRPAARQLVTHKKICVNGLPATIPSITLKPGDTVGVTQKARTLAVIQESLAQPPKKYAWLVWDASKMTGKLTELPIRKGIPEKIDEQRIVELYSK